MRIIGGFYIFLGLINTPPIVAARMDLQYPTLNMALDHVAVKAINDLWFVFGTEMAVIGLMLIAGSAAPLRSKILVRTVLLLELIRGILLDVYWISRGYYVNFHYVAWIVIHLVIIVSGWRALQRAEYTAAEGGRARQSDLAGAQ
jgi:hypothetical protein